MFVACFNRLLTTFISKYKDTTNSDYRFKDSNFWALDQVRDFIQSVEQNGNEQILIVSGGINLDNTIQPS